MDALDLELGFARVDEVARIAEMSRDLIEAGLGWSYRPERVAGMLADPESVTVVARERRRLLGFGVLGVGEERAHLKLFAVLPTHRRQGIGRRMLGWLVETAATAGVATVHLELIADNQAAGAFYRAQGFVETMRVPGYYRGVKAAIRMIRVLRDPR